MSGFLDMKLVELCRSISEPEIQVEKYMLEVGSGKGLRPRKELKLDEECKSYFFRFGTPKPHVKLSK